MSWQAVGQDIESLVEDYWVAVMNTREEHARTSLEKKSKMAAGRMSARTRSGDENQSDSRDADRPNG